MFNQSTCIDILGGQSAITDDKVAFKHTTDAMDALGIPKVEQAGFELAP